MSSQILNWVNLHSCRCRSQLQIITLARDFQYKNGIETNEDTKTFLKDKYYWYFHSPYLVFASFSSNFTLRVCIFISRTKNNIKTNERKVNSRTQWETRFFFMFFFRLQLWLVWDFVYDFAVVGCLVVEVKIGKSQLKSRTIDDFLPAHWFNFN